MLEFWLPLLLLFVSAVIGTLFSKRKKDLCLKFLNGRKVYIRQQSGTWVWGMLRVFSNALDVSYTDAADPQDGLLKQSYIFYQPHLSQISRILCPSPEPGSPERARWDRAVKRVAQPTLLRRIARSIRNLFNTLRDAFHQASVLLLGSLKQKTRMGRIQTMDQRAGEINRTLIDAVPNAYEPALECYLSRLVVVEELSPNGTVEEFAGILQEYTDKYLLLRGVESSPRLLDTLCAEPIASDRFDVVFPRTCTLVRHRASVAPH